MMENVLQIGLGIPHTGPTASPPFIRRYCEAAEDLGYGSLWTVDHVVLPQHVNSTYTLGRAPRRVEPDAVERQLAPNFESVSTLLWVAGFTSRVRLGTAVSILPLRNPLLNAAMLSTLDAYSAGRLVFGVGAGWLEEEARAMQVPWDHRGARTEEHIEILRRFWLASEGSVAFRGRFYQFDSIAPYPRPVQQPPPIVIGGHSDRAIERAARLGDGWIAASMSPERLREHWARVQQAAERHGRDPASLMLVNSTKVRITDSAADPLADAIDALRTRVDEYAAIGVDHLKLTMSSNDPDVLLAATEHLAQLGR